MERSVKRKRSTLTGHTTFNGITVTPAQKQHIKFNEENLDTANSSTPSEDAVSDLDVSDLYEDDTRDEESDEDDAPEEVAVSESRRQILRAEDASSRLKELQNQTAKRKRRELDAKLKLQKTSSTKDVPTRIESENASRFLPTDALEKAVARDRYLDMMEDRAFNDLSKKSSSNIDHNLMTEVSLPRSTKLKSNNSIHFSGSLRLQIHDTSEEATNKILAPAANKNSKNRKDTWRGNKVRSRQHGLQPLKKGFLRT